MIHRVGIIDSLKSTESVIRPNYTNEDPPQCCRFVNQELKIIFMRGYGSPKRRPAFGNGAENFELNHRATVLYFYLLHFSSTLFSHCVLPLDVYYVLV